MTDSHRLMHAVMEFLNMMDAMTHLIFFLELSKFERWLIRSLYYLELENYIIMKTNV